MSSIPGLGRSPGGEHGNPLQYSGLENPVDRGAWRAAVHRVKKSRIQLSDLACRQGLGEGKVKVAQLYLTLCDPMDYTVRGILQARTLEWVEGGSNRPRVTAGGRRDSGDGTLHGCQAGLSQGGSGNTVGDRASRAGGCPWRRQSTGETQAWRVWAGGENTQGGGVCVRERVYVCVCARTHAHACLRCWEKPR